ncbi:MAG TPA: right-handed parallel beta-helix repeat-containing protein [Candidatus Sulfotelmatobacter sp.]|nr:right-handed parallel beta-helix repeat-containing protein [Candidatus Sulfotelmatobacter sp.]
MKNPIYLILGSLLLAGVNLSAATLYVSTNSPDPQPPYATWSTAATNIQDAVSSAEAGDFIVVTDGVYAGGVTVSNPVTLSSVNGANSTVITGGGPCISLTNGASLTGFTVTGGQSNPIGGVLCSSSNVFLIDCVISNNISLEAGVAGVIGGTLTNCTITDNNGGTAGIGGAYDSILNNCTITDNIGDLTGGADDCTLTGCTVGENNCDNDAGGALDCTLNSCIIADNSCAFLGGGVENCSLDDCLLYGNIAFGAGGGAFTSSLTNCTLSGNSATGDNPGPLGGGGAFGCTLNNCISYFNGAPAGANYDTNSILNYCCTIPLPTTGFGNITNNPLFVDAADDNFQLQSNSPCINAGNNAYVTSPTDLAGNPRIVGGTVDIGAYEFQTPTSVISYAYLQQYGLPTDGSVDDSDLDGTGFNVYQDWVAGLNPTNPASILAMLSPAPTNNLAGITVRWKSVDGVQYLLQRSTNLLVQPVFPTIQENIPGQGGTNTYQDSSATNNTPYFYRVGVVAP